MDTTELFRVEFFPRGADAEKPEQWAVRDYMARDPKDASDQFMEDFFPAGVTGPDVDAVGAVWDGSRYKGHISQVTPTAEAD